jgi:hypothetical protein
VYRVAFISISKTLEKGHRGENPNRGVLCHKFCEPLVYTVPKQSFPCVMFSIVELSANAMAVHVSPNLSLLALMF